MERVEDNPLQILLEFWNRLALVSTLRLIVKTKSQEGWMGQGVAEVTVQTESDNILIFHEKGSWLTKAAGETAFSNIYRFTLDRRQNLISMEHLRYGIKRPVFLFHLRPTDQRTLSSVDSHLCGDDTYLGKVFCDQNHLRLNWRVIGPKKNDEIDCVYS